ncbi:MAG: M16 family metallopeptidase, partial [Alphaproteobacteria bacterium]
MALAILSLALAGMALPVARAHAAEVPSQEAPGVLRATLENGLRVVIVRNRLAPVVTTSVNVLVGADETPPGFPGMAHAQEHMMFRGNPGLAGDQLAYLSAMMGGSFDAVTRQNVTQYFFTVPAEDLDVALNIEAIRLKDVLDREKDWAQERGAIEQEVAQDLSSPRYVLYAKLRAALFAGTTYAHDALGTRPSFDKTTGAMLKAFHDKWYAPNNTVLVVAGDLEPAATLAKVKALFGAIPARALPPRPGFALAPLQAQSVQLSSNLPDALSVIAFRMPGLESADYAAAELLGDVLASPRGELYGMVPAGKALSADFSYEALPKAGLAYSLVSFPAEGDPAAVEKEVRAILARIAREGVPADLVAAAKRQERRVLEFQRNAIADLATAWAEAVAVNGLASPDEWLERLEKTSVA